MQVVTAVLLGLPMTLLVTAAAFAIGLVGGIPLMLGLRSRWRPVRLLFRLVVDLVRGIPPIVWLFLLYFGISFGGIRLNSLSAAIVGLGVISAAYLSEIYRGGFATLPAGQLEASRALGLGRASTFLRVLAPQAVRTSLPSIATFLLALVKDSSIASTIGVTEMVFAANTFVRQNPTTAGLTPFFVAAGVYVVISIPLAVVSRRLDARLRRSM